MISKNLISKLRALHIGKNRIEQNLFLAEGEKVVKELLLSGVKTRYLFALPSYIDENQVLLGATEVHEVNEEELRKISTQVSPNRVVAVAEIPEQDPGPAVSDDKIVLMLDGINDPGNLGTMIRTAEWFGIKTIYCSLNSVHCYNPKVVMGSMGSLFRIKVVYEDLKKVVIRYRDAGFAIYGATLDGKSLNEISNVICAIIIGSESHGVHQELLDLCDEQLSINKNPGSKAESLNAAVACGILLAEFSKP